jgi:hypothetical protein
VRVTAAGIVASAPQAKIEGCRDWKIPLHVYVDRADMGEPSRPVRPHPSCRSGSAVPEHRAAHGIAFKVAAALFNVIWWYARHDRRLLADTIHSAGVRAISRRFQLALAWIGAGTLLVALLPALGVAVIAAFVVYYWLPISGEIGRAKPRTNLGNSEGPPHGDGPSS